NPTQSPDHGGMATILTLDLGTTNFKAALFDRDGSLIALERSPTPVARLSPDQAVIELDRFHQAVRDLLAALRHAAPEAFLDAAALSFATQTNSFILIDPRDEPLTPIILWSDDRAAGLADRLPALSE